MSYQTLGETPSANFSSGASTFTTVANTAGQYIKTGDPEFQSKFSKFNEKQAKILAAATPFLSSIPPLALVVGAVAALSGLVAKIFYTSKAKLYAAERGQYEIAIGQIRDENFQLDAQIKTLKEAYNNLLTVVGIEGKQLNGLSGLGFCLINCNKGEEERKLDQTKATFEQLKQQQQQKIDLVYSLFSEVDNLLSIKNNTDTSLYIAIALLTIGVGFYLVKKSKQKWNRNRKSINGIRKTSSSKLTGSEKEKG